VGIDHAQTGDVVADQFARRVCDRLEHFRERRAARDRALDLRVSLEQLLTLLQRVEAA